MSIRCAPSEFETHGLVRFAAVAAPGEIVAVVGGASGSIMALPQSGVSARTEIVTIGPEPDLFPWLSVADNVAFGRTGLTPFSREGLVANALGRAGLGGLEGRWPHQLTAEQRHGVAIARMFLARPRLLLLAQPFARLGRKAQTRLFGLLSVLRQETGLRVLLAPRDLDQALLFADRILIAASSDAVTAGFVNLQPHPREPESAGFRALRRDIQRLLPAPPVEQAQLRLGVGAAVAL